MSQISSLQWLCAWCHPGVSGPNITHGICATHKQQVLEGTYQPPKPVQCPVCGGARFIEGAPCLRCNHSATRNLRFALK